MLPSAAVSHRKSKLPRKLPIRRAQCCTPRRDRYSVGDSRKVEDELERWQSLLEVYMTKGTVITIYSNPGEAGLDGNAFSCVGAAARRRLRVLFAAGREIAGCEDFDDIWKTDCWSLGFRVVRSGSERGTRVVESASIGEWPRF